MAQATTAVITGSTSGIGAGIAEALAAAGHDIVLNGFGNPDEIQAERMRLADAHGVTVAYVPADMKDPAQIHAMFDEAATRLGPVGILVNNAGIQHVAPVDEFPQDRLDDIIAINLVAAFHTIRAVLPGMKAAGWGRIVNTASTHALVASPYKSAYVAAKHGLLGLTKTVALEVAEAGITVNAICPGYVWTPLVANQVADTAAVRGMTEDEVKRDVLLAAQPTRQFVTIEQVGALVAFLCSDAAAQITGAALPVDGGWTAA